MTNKDRFLNICKTEIKREGIEKLIKWLTSSDFFAAPSSTKYHGSYEGGLCEHSLNVYDRHANDAVVGGFDTVILNNGKSA